jgi:hypothetical protein
MTAQDANVCRRAWKVTSSSLAASTALLYGSVICERDAATPEKDRFAADTH